MAPQVETENIEMADESEVKEEEQKQAQINTSAKRDFSSLQKFEDDSPEKTETRVAVIDQKNKAEQLKPPTLQNVVATADLH